MGKEVDADFWKYQVLDRHVWHELEEDFVAEASRFTRAEPTGKCD